MEAKTTYDAKTIYESKDNLWMQRQYMKRKTACECKDSMKAKTLYECKDSISMRYLGDKYNIWKKNVGDEWVPPGQLN